MPIVKFKVFHAKVGDENALHLDYRGYLKSHDLKKRFTKVRHIKNKKHFCTNQFYRKMQGGLKMYFNYYDQNKQFITKLYLDEEICCLPNEVINDTTFL